MSKKLIIFVALLLCGVPTFGQSVDTAWVRRYNGPGNSADYAQAIAVDGSGNVYMTGWSWGSETDYDYATIKYDPNGDTVWVRRYNGSTDSADHSYAVALDDSGNVYITGGSSGSGTFLDYATIKYFPDGDTAWVRRYNGPANFDYALAIAVDDSRNVYVTGTSGTIKYSSSGSQLWVQPLDGRDITVDDSGDVYVTGHSGIIKYSTNGAQLWVQPLGGGIYITIDIEVDDSGNIYVAGDSYDTITSYLDYAIIKYYPNGDTAWVRRYHGIEDSDDFLAALSIDGSGNVYVTGMSYSVGTNWDYSTIKYYPNGDTAWARRYNGPSNFEDWASDIAMDGSGNVYVTGFSFGPGTSTDYATIKYSPNGETAWVRRYNRLANSADNAYALAVDSSGNLYVTGVSHDFSTNYDCVTIKYVQFLRGDANADKQLRASDVVYLINYLFKGGPVPVPALIVGDANCDGKITVADVIYLINYVLKGGPQPCI